MKKLKLLTVVLLLTTLSLSAFSQKIYILTDERQQCTLNYATKNIFNCQANVEFPSAFIFDVDFDFDGFYHMIEGLDSKYTAMDSELFDGSLVLQTINNVGNKHEWHFDFGARLVYAVFMNDPNQNLRNVVIFRMAHTLLVE